ncbi:3-isopropylmalate dehydratase [Shinella sp. BE166]|uniref:LeuD/DmdB family oxidoreductase small subunit n=1 Tax=Shinella sp. BE166 TaxID=3373918 RepID=UPI003EB891C4
MKIRGRTWTFGVNVNTDLIFPKPYFRPAYEPGEMASHLMAGIDEGFASKVRPGDIIVGGLNFGCGSSREEAAGAMREAGIAAVVAPSFGRLFMRNGINFGIPIVALADIDRHVTEGDELEIDLDISSLRNLATGYHARLAPMAPESLRMMQEGGIKAYTRRILAERRAAGA